MDNITERKLGEPIYRNTSLDRTLYYLIVVYINNNTRWIRYNKMATTSPVPAEDAAATFYHEHCTYLPAMLGWFFFSAILSELSVSLCLSLCLSRGQ